MAAARPSPRALALAWGAGLVLAAALFLLPSLARARESSRPRKAVSRTTAASEARKGETKRPLVRSLAIGPVVSPASADLRVAIDPVTGTIVRPGPGQLRELGIESLRRAQGPPLVERLPDGSLIAYLDDRSMSYWVTRVDSAGNMRTVCVDGAEAADRVLRTGAPATAAKPAKVAR